MATTKNGNGADHKRKPVGTRKVKAAKPAKAKKPGMVQSLMICLAKEPTLNKEQLVAKLIKSGFQPSQGAVGVFMFAYKNAERALTDVGRLKAA